MADPLQAAREALRGATVWVVGGAVRDRRPYSWVNESLGTSLRRVFRQRPRRAVVRLGAPIPSEGETRKTLAAKTRAAVAALDPLGQGVQA